MIMALPFRKAQDITKKDPNLGTHYHEHSNLIIYNSEYQKQNISFQYLNKTLDPK